MNSLLKGEEKFFKFFMLNLLIINIYLLEWRKPLYLVILSQFFKLNFMFTIIALELLIYF